jgi:hypothetical protein
MPYSEAEIAVARDFLLSPIYIRRSWQEGTNSSAIWLRAEVEELNSWISAAAAKGGWVLRE